MAALADNTDAQVEYAIALFNGDGVAKNEQAAAALFQQAALHGNAVAQDRLARILAEGRGAPENPVEATKWHLISKARGETDLTLDDFVNRLDPTTRAAGEKAAQPWHRRAEGAEGIGAGSLFAHRPMFGPRRSRRTTLYPADRIGIYHWYLPRPPLP